MKKRILSVLLTALMLIGLFPTSVLAADSDVASLNGTEYATIQAAVEAAEDGDEITLISDIALTTESYVTNSDGYAVFVNVANKAVTIDLNGKSVTVDASAADLTGAKSTMLLGVFSADDNSVLTLKDSVGTGSVTVNANDATVYSLVCAYNGVINIESGSYSVDKLGEGRGMIYSNASDHSGADGSNVVVGTNVSGGYFSLGNIGTLANGSPWIFNVSGTGTEWTLVTGGTYNVNVQRQFWANEIMIPTTHYIEKNADNTWTVKEGAVLFVEEGALTGPYYMSDWKIGYPSLEAFIAAATAGDPITIDMSDAITLLEDITVTTDVDLSGLNLNLNGKSVSVAAEGTFTVPENSAIVPVAANGYTLVTTENQDGTVTYSVTPIVYTVTYTDGVSGEVLFADQTSSAPFGTATPAFAGTPAREGYTFVGWTPAVSATVTGNATYTAVFEKISVEEEPTAPFSMWMIVYMRLYKTYDIASQATVGGTVTTADAAPRYNEDVTYIITPDEGYEIVDVLVDGESVGAVSEYTFTDVRKDHTISAVFAESANTEE
ncbi:MAG: hypothetical protein E7632_05250 [Ruminococcaceae bacterium]|nr:hypothetical protein [Oscillospiraceae bacterium]